MAWVTSIRTRARCLAFDARDDSTVNTAHRRDQLAASAARAQRTAELQLAFRITIGLELLAALAASAFGIFLAIYGKGVFDLRSVGWVFAGVGVSVLALDSCVLLGKRWARLTRTALAFVAVFPLGYWAVKHPDAATSGAFAVNLGIFWLGFITERRTSTQAPLDREGHVAAATDEH